MIPRRLRRLAPFYGWVVDRRPWAADPPPIHKTACEAPQAARNQEESILRVTESFD